MENWDVSRRTAYRLMNRYGMTRQYKKTASEDVAAVQQQASDIAEYSWKYTAEKYQKEVAEKDKEIAELKAEIERLKNLINR